MIERRMVLLRNCEPLALSGLPVLSTGDFRTSIIRAVRQGCRLVAYFGHPRSNGSILVVAVLALKEGDELAVLSMEAGQSYPSLTPDCPQAHWFERELAEQWGVNPEGHPWLKPIRFHRPWREDPSAPGASDGDPLPSVTDFFHLEGEEVHEVAVGPVHAGVIEPGHFRFQCHGEEVVHLEISLGYQHRGIERALVGGPDKRTIHLMETAAGDTSVGHALAYAQVLEALGHVQVPPRGLALRGVALELERIANHIGDLGALAGDVGFLPTASYCGRIRGDVLNMTALVCGSRFGRGWIRPGGVSFDLSDAIMTDLLERLAAASKDAAEATGLIWETPSVTARMEGVGIVTLEVCQELGVVGPAARASGLDRDVRKDMPFGIYQYAQIPTATWDDGDVFGRAHVREIEIQRSFAFVIEQLKNLSSGQARSDLAPPAGETMVVSMVEGWRGEIAHVALTDGRGRFARYKIVDPSFHNWFALAWAMRGAEISDFPLCNKSFNLSYCGHDL
jgi:Ni,Fe-hydrogenase III large subunit